MEYNNSEKYNDDTHPDTTTCSGDPEVFAGPLTWNQSIDLLKSLVRDYETAFANWKLSGNHGSFGEVDPSKASLPFSNFIKNNHSLFYLHEFTSSFPDVFAKVTGALPKGVFIESAGSGDSVTTSSSAKKWKRQSNPTAEAMKEFSQNSKEKN